MKLCNELDNNEFLNFHRTSILSINKRPIVYWRHFKIFLQKCKLWKLITALADVRSRGLSLHAKLQTRLPLLVVVMNGKVLKAKTHWWLIHYTWIDCQGRGTMVELDQWRWRPASRRSFVTANWNLWQTIVFVRRQFLHELRLLEQRVNNLFCGFSGSEDCVVEICTIK